MSIPIYKILTPEQWSLFQSTQSFAGAPIDLADGYMHFSTAKQAQETADKHFKAYEKIILARCDPNEFSGHLKWEPSRGGDLFPHLYAAPLPIKAVDAYWTLELGEHGFAFPEEI